METRQTLPYFCVLPLRVSVGWRPISFLNILCYVLCSLNFVFSGKIDFLLPGCTYCVHFFWIQNRIQNLFKHFAHNLEVRLQNNCYIYNPKCSWGFKSCLEMIIAFFFKMKTHFDLDFGSVSIFTSKPLKSVSNNPQCF